MTDLEAVCFDLDNTLCVPELDDERIHRRIFERVDVDPFFDPADVHAVDPANLPRADSTRDHYENLYRAVTENVGGNQGHAPDLAAATVEVLDPTAVRFRDGARAAFRDASERYDVGLLTVGSPETQSEKIDALGIGDALDAVVVCDPGSDDALKPDPEPFRELLADLDATPEHSVYVGDSLEGDVGGANGVGMASVWVPTDEPPVDPDPEPTAVLDSMAELPETLRDI